MSGGGVAVVAVYTSHKDLGHSAVKHLRLWDFRERKFLFLPYPPAEPVTAVNTTGRSLVGRREVVAAHKSNCPDGSFSRMRRTTPRYLSNKTCDKKLVTIYIISSRPVACIILYASRYNIRVCAPDPSTVIYYETPRASGKMAVRPKTPSPGFQHNHS